MRFRNTLKIIALFLMLTVSAAAQNAALKARLDTVIYRALKDEKLVGADILVAQDGKIIYRRTAGFNDREERRRPKKNDVFRLASMTKLIVSATALALVDEGKLKIDDPVTKYLPDFRPKLTDGSTPTITVKHLLTHTSGLNYGFAENPNGEYHKLQVSDGLDDTGISLDENVRRISLSTLLFAPGTKRNYSLNMGEGAVVFSPQPVTNPKAFYSGGAPILKPESAKLLTENALGELEINGGDSGVGFSLGASVLKNPEKAKTPQSVGTWSWGGVYGHSYFVDPQKILTVIGLTNTTVAGMTGDFPNAIVKAIYAQ